MISTTCKLIEIDSSNSNLLKKIGMLRIRAWSTVFPDLPAKFTTWLDEFELRSRHWCVFHKQTLIAAARLSVHDNLSDVPDSHVYQDVFGSPPAPPIASINRLVVHPDYRGQRLSCCLDSVRITAARKAGCRCCIAYTLSNPTRVRQLLQMGFEKVADVDPEPVVLEQQSGSVLLCSL